MQKREINDRTRSNRRGFLGRTRYLVAIAVVCLVPLTSTVLAADSWLHIRVDGRNEETVDVNVPLSLVRAMLPAIDTGDLRFDDLDLGRHELDGVDLREIIDALRDAPDADYVRVRGRDESVRVAKENGFLIVVADENRDRVRVSLPLEVVYALIDSESDSLDLLAALDVLENFDGDLVTVESEDENVRIWIDTSQTGN